MTETPVPEINTDLIDEQLTDAIQSLNEQRQLVLALAYLRGYDGVDIINLTHWMTHPEDFRHSYTFEGWHDNPPEMERFAHSFTRYDFRDLTDEEKRTLQTVVPAWLTQQIEADSGP